MKFSKAHSNIYERIDHNVISDKDVRPIIAPESIDIKKFIVGFVTMDPKSFFVLLVFFSCHFVGSNSSRQAKIKWINLIGFWKKRTVC